MSDARKVFQDTLAPKGLLCFEQKTLDTMTREEKVAIITLNRIFAPEKKCS